VPDDPLVSFIVLSYNYERYVGAALRSILAQTHSNLEVVVVDDDSTDGSLEIIRSFGDARIRLHLNERNIGGAASYNRAVALARGEFLVNVDADDWIAPQKTATQLTTFARDSSLDILGTHVSFVDETGGSHPRAEELETTTNQSHDFNLLDTWIVQNCLCRSSTMIRRSVHDRIGLNDPAMVRAPDYELWTRALRGGCRFGLVPECLTFLRLHTGGVTHGDARGTYREICYLLLKNIVPLVEERSGYTSFGRLIEWVISQEQFVLMRPAERYWLLGMFFSPSRPGNFDEFGRALSAPETDPLSVTVGNRFLALHLSDSRVAVMEKLERDLQQFIEARDFFRQQAVNWQREAEYERKRAEDLERRVKQRVDSSIAIRLRRLLSKG